MFIIKLIIKNHPDGLEMMIDKYHGLAKYVITNILKNQNMEDKHLGK